MFVSGTSDRGEDISKLRDAYRYKRDHNLGVDRAFATLVMEYPGKVHKNYELQTEMLLARNGEMRRWDCRGGAQDGWLV